MKYIILLCDGMADVPVPLLGNLTPMEKALKPNMDTLFSTAWVGTSKTVPDHMPAGSDVANLSVFGYDPEKYYTGRSPLEAISMNLTLKDNDTALRCNLVTLGGTGSLDLRTMEDYSAGEIGTEEAKELIQSIAEKMNCASKRGHWSFHPGISYRHCMIWENGPLDIQLTPPHDISGKSVKEWLPKGPGSEIIRELMEDSAGILDQHPINIKRRAHGLNPANFIWLWGQGRKPALPTMKELYGIDGSVISAVDLIKGIGIAAELSSIHVIGATGNLHTNYRGKAIAALEQLKAGKDFVYIHVEAPDECGHQGQALEKTTAIERIDAELLAVLLEDLPEIGDFRILIMPDHPTPVGIRTHTHEPVPFLLFDSRKNLAFEGQKNSFTEENAKLGTYIEHAYTLIKHLLEP